MHTVLTRIVSKILYSDKTTHRYCTSILINNLYFASPLKQKIRLYSMKTSMSHQTSSSRGSDKVHVQQNHEKDIVTISFEYSFEGRSKQFNLQRKGSELLSSSLERIKLNLSKMETGGRKTKSKSASESDKRTNNIELSVDGSALNSFNTKNMDAWIEGAVLNLNGKTYEVSTNSPLVESMKLPSCLMKGFIIMPRLNLMNCFVENCKFAWYRQISSLERQEIVKSAGDEFENMLEYDGRYWCKLSDSMTYIPTVEDVAHILMVICWPIDGTKEGPLSVCISSVPVEIGPTNCPFEKRHSFTQDNLPEPHRFRVVSYNILADLYADSDYSRTVLFGHCPSYALDYDYRRQILLKEISGYNSDLICLQEVDKKEFERTFEPFFNFVGSHKGIFSSKGGQVAEGAATFYREDKFELMESHKTLLSKLIDYEDEKKENSNDKVCPGSTSPQSLCEESDHMILSDPTKAKECLSKFKEINSALVTNTELMKRFVDRHTILQTSLLRFRGSLNDFVLVGNTHLYFAPDADHVRLLQGIVCLKYLEYLKNYYQERMKPGSSPNVNIILCGDMNSTPDCGLYKLLTRGKIAPDIPDWSSNENEAIAGISVETELRFSSAYQDIPYTNYTPEFKGCLDYIYYERDNLTCETTIPLPDHEDVTAIGGLPSEVFPSDHLALIANLQLVKTNH